MGFIGNGCHCLFDGERGVGVRLGLIGPPLGELSTELEGVGPGPISFRLTDAVGSLSRWPPPLAGGVDREAGGRLWFIQKKTAAGTVEPVGGPCPSKEVWETLK